MTKLTRCLKKNKKNRTFKRGGAIEDVTPPEKLKTEDLPKEEREGIIDMIQNKIANVVSSAATTVGDVGLKFVGLERINKSKEEEDVSIKVDNNIGKLANVVNKTGAIIIDNVNEVLGSNDLKQAITEAAEKTAEIVKEAAEKFNEALNKPEVKAQVKESIEKAGEIGTIVLEASEKPIQKAVDVAANASQKASAAALSGIVKVGTGMAAAVPGVGAVIEVGKMLNDGSKATSAVIEAGSEALEAASDAFLETKTKFEEGLKVLEEKKKLGDVISSRTDKSIKEFENPVTTQAAGARKTRRRLLKYRGKSKRVRFAI